MMAFLARLDTYMQQVREEQQREAAAETARLNAIARDAEQRRRKHAEAAANHNKARKDAASVLMQQEAAHSAALQAWNVDPAETTEPTAEEQTKSALANMMHRVILTCNWQQVELARQARTIAEYEETLKGLHARLDVLEKDDVPHRHTSSSSIDPSIHEVEERMDHLVALVGNLNSFRQPSIISQQIAALQAELGQLQQQPIGTCNSLMSKQFKMPKFNIDRFDDYHKADPISWQRRRSSTTKLGKLSSTGSEATPLPTPLDTVALLATSSTSGEHAYVASLHEGYEDYAIQLVPPLDQPLHVQESYACATSTPSPSEPASSSTLFGDSSIWSRLEELDPLTVEDFQWLPLPPSGSLLKPHCNALMAELRTYLHAAVPAPLMEDGVAVVDLHEYIAKIDHRYATQREEELEVLRTQLDDLVDKGWIRPSCSPYGAPVLFVRKKNKELRLCIAYCKLNAQTNKNAGPLPRIDDIFERLGDAKYFSKLDLKAGYHQLEIHPRDRYKTAVKTWYGHFEWVVMPFGLTNAPTTFQAAMTMEFRGMLDWFVLIYLDDILVYSRNLDEHIVHLRAVLDRLRTTKYKANRAKCEFAQQELEYLGHFVTPQGIRPLADKIKAIQDWSEPTNNMELRSFMGLVGYYQRFIGGYSRIAAPLSRLQSPKVPLQFTDEVRSSFHKLKTALFLAPILSIYDLTLPTRVTTDAFGYGMGAVLEQHDGVDWHPVEYFSQKVLPINSVDDARNVRAYKSDPEYATLYEQLSSDHPPASHYRDQEYKAGKRMTNKTLEIQSLDKREDITIDLVSNQDFTEDECKRLRQVMKLGIYRPLRVGELEEKAVTLQGAKVKEFFDTERQRLANLRDRANLLQRHEAASIERPKFWHFEPSNGDDATPEEQHKEFLSKLVTRLLYACNYQQSELERQNQELQQQYQDLQKQHQELANLCRTVQSHEDATRALNSRVLELEQAVPGPDAGVSRSAPFNRQLEERVDHVVAMLGDISTFGEPTTISNQLDTLKTEVQQLQLPNKNGNNTQHYKMPTFQIEKFDDYTHQDPVLWWEATHGVDAADLKDKITWEELTRLWKKRFIVDDAPALAINRLFNMTQGNTATRDWLTEWQKIAATPDLDLPFTHLRREFYNRSCAALSLALGDRDQYATFAENIDKAREIIKTNRAAAHEKSTWQPTYVEKVRTGPQQQQFVAVRSDNTVEDPAAIEASRPHGVVPDRPIRHEIILEDGAVPPRGCIYRMSEEELSVLRAQLDDLLEKGWIRPNSSPYGAPVLFVWKKNKDLRLCIDYRKLNAQTIRNAGPLPRIDDLLERLGGAKFFSKLDLKSGYHQLEIRKEDRYKTVFKTRYGYFEWPVMPFGLTNAPATFQAAMITEFRLMLDRYVLIYLDDILVYNRSLDEHVEHLRTVLERLRQAKYKANRDKCEFARQELEYLGHYVTPQGIRPLADNIEALRVWPEPTNTTDVRSFMGLAGYYQRFITGYSRIVAPMTRLQSPKVPFVFDDDAHRSFQALKTTMLIAPVLSIYDPTLPTRVTTDASGYGIGAVLEQHDGDDWHPVEFFSHKVPPINLLDDARKELLSFVMALKRWWHFLLGHRRFTWVTDNNPLTYYETQDTVSSTIGRWMYFIDQFDFTLKHFPGLSNRATDALSRRPDLCGMTHHAFAFDEELQRHFIRGYESDPDFATLYAQLSSDHPPASHYRIVDGYLLLHSRGKDLLCVPRDRRLRTRLLGEYHDSRLAGHFGVNRTIARLRQRFRWPDLITDVTRYCDSCEVCRRSKPRNRNPYGELRPMPIPQEPCLSIAVDVTGPFPRDRLGHDDILTVVDRLSHLVRIFVVGGSYNEASSLGSVGSTVAQTQSQSTGVMASQPLVMTPEEVAIQRGVDRETQLQKDLREIKAEKERMIRRRARLQRRQADISELEEMDPTEWDDQVRTLRSVLLGVVEMQDQQTTILQDIQQSLVVLVGRAQAVPSLSNSPRLLDERRRYHHPEANGQTEQLNRVVQHLLRHYIKPNQVDWDEKLALIASLYNNVVNSATGVSPNSLPLTFKPKLPLDFLLPENQSTVAPDTSEFAHRYEQKMQQAVEQMRKAQVAMIEYENKHHRPSTFQVGNRVWVKSSELGQEHGISRKLMPQYFGPWEVLDILGTDPERPSYVIRIPGHLRTYPVFHASKLAPFEETDQFPSRRSMLPPTMDGEVDIDGIVDHKELRVPRPIAKGRPPEPKLQYRVRFRHHIDPKEDRWFTREELMQTAPQVVAQYEKALQKGKRQIVLLTSYLRCFPMPLRNQLAGEANINMHNFPSFSKKALDLEAKIGHGHNPTTDGRKKSLPPNWKAKGRIMFVDNDSSTIESDDEFQARVGSEVGSVEASGGGVVAVVAQKVIEQYDFEPQYIKGEYNKVADVLSCRPDFSGALITEFGLADDVTCSMVEAYREDRFMSEIIRRLEAKDKVTSAEFVLVNGLLFLEKAGNKRLCVPDRESLRSLFLGECHDATRHFGFKKTAANLLQQFWWPTMMRDAKLYVETCQMTSGNHPEANGQAKQLNRAVQHLLQHYIKPNQVEWDEKLALIASLYNNDVHSATGVASMESSHGAQKLRELEDPEVRQAKLQAKLEIEADLHMRPGFESDSDDDDDDLPPEDKGEDPKVDVAYWVAAQRTYLSGFKCDEDVKVSAILARLERSALKWCTSTSNKQGSFTFEDSELDETWEEDDAQCLADLFLSLQEKKKHKSELILLRPFILGAKIKGLLYCGATHNFISPKAVIKLHLHHRLVKLQQPIEVRIGDSSTVRITIVVKGLPVSFEEQGEIRHRLNFFVFPNVPFDLVFSMQWLGATNPRIDWRIPRVELPDRHGVYRPCMLADEYHPASSCFCMSPHRFLQFSRQTDHARLFVAYVKQTGVEVAPCPFQIQQVEDSLSDLMEEPTGLVHRQTKHKVEILPSSVPPKGRVYRMSPAELEELRKQLETLTSKGWIRPNTFEFGAPVLFVPQGNGEFRMCVDYRGLNKMRKSTKPLPRIDDLLDMVQGCTIFSKIDVKSGYHEIEMAEGDVYKTTFKTSQYGVGAVLQQDDGNGLHPIEYMSKKIKTKKLQDSIYEKELYALVSALKHWKHFLLGMHFKIFSDHSTLQGMKSQGELNDKLARYIQFIDMFDFELRHKKGCYNRVADALSCRPDALFFISSTHSFVEKTRQIIGRLLPQDERPIVRNLQDDPASELGYTLVSGLLYTCNRGEERLCIPHDRKLRTLLMSECHDARGHFGALKSYAALSQRFFWKEIRSDMLHYVETYELCQRNKVVRRPPLGLLKPLPIPDALAQSVSIDFTDLGRTTPRGMRQVMVCVDWFSKYAEFIPLPAEARVPAV
ncbi:hypothetical protein CBR_g54812 [Chara braunii]|uniref:RNA-directed DNA polymerase n=1 Tax=Chara braunii TaxID=69332 RepID=A0A388JPK0_CHABU|nr:hypothetical protein CBR_g54812 [Chara braunii]|eukprot:GBG59707.1 hypothetical protein CBR_g54812 [Chara braunii]